MTTAWADREVCLAHRHSQGHADGPRVPWLADEEAGVAARDYLAGGASNAATSAKYRSARAGLAGLV